ncbi:hypothetical protein F783_006780 [Bordetella holmesii F627]|nr:hypothetical protein F783_006780 [Bordetella holmesii F627]
MAMPEHAPERFRKRVGIGAVGEVLPGDEQAMHLREG